MNLNRNERQDDTMDFEWKVEDMALMNEKGNIYICNEKIYKAENELTREEKIERLYYQVN